MLGVGIVGAGWVSGEHIKAYSNNPNTRIVGILSRTREGAERKRDELGIECRVYDSLDQMLDDDKIQIISICSRSDLHSSQARLGARAGKHLVIEKPIALTLEDLWSLEADVAEYRVKTVVSFVLRWNPFFQMVKRLLNDGALGSLFYASCDYWNNTNEHWPGFKWGRTRQGGGSSMLLSGCHAADAVRWFAGEVVEVSAFAADRNPDSPFEFNPNVVASLRYASGAVGKVSSLLECYTPYRFNVELFGDQGTLRNNRLFSHKLLGQTDYAEIPTVLPDSSDVSHHPFQAEIDHFVRCILKDRESHANVADAAKSHELCFAIDRSCKTGETISLPLADRPKSA